MTPDFWMGVVVTAVAVGCLYAAFVLTMAIYRKGR